MMAVGKSSACHHRQELEDKGTRGQGELGAPTLAKRGEAQWGLGAKGTRGRKTSILLPLTRYLLPLTSYPYPLNYELGIANCFVGAGMNLYLR